LIQKIKDNISKYYEQTLYYGPKDLKAIVSELQKIHTIPAKFAVPAKKEFKQKNKLKIKFFC
jgi:predicted glycosyltransferase